jgi:branched-subunit amino acid aminotransferase/4-amino-4-deoxychorismate lyase
MFIGLVGANLTGRRVLTTIERPIGREQEQQVALQQSVRLEEVWSRIVAQAWADPQLKERLLNDPAAVLREQGVEVPAGAIVKVSRLANDLDKLARIMSLLWLDGQIVRREKFYIDPSDEGLLFGRGLWESTRTFGGVPWLWPAHIERLLRTAALLEMSVAPERLPDSNQVSEYVRALGVGDLVVRLNVTAGCPGMAGIVWMGAAPLPPRMPSARLESCRSPILKGEPSLAWKTFQYGARLGAGRKANRAGFDSALLLDPQDNLLEAANTNIFVRLPDGWATPAADGGMLPGTVRQQLLGHAPLPICEQTIPYKLLSQAREAFLTNSIVGIVPVVQIDERAFPIGSETLQLLRWLQPQPAT